MYTRQGREPLNRLEKAETTSKKKETWNIEVNGKEEFILNKGNTKMRFLLKRRTSAISLITAPHRQYLDRFCHIPEFTLG